jgi:hypothetical protein
LRGAFERRAGFRANFLMAREARLRLIPKAMATRGEP